MVTKLYRGVKCILKISTTCYHLKHIDDCLPINGFYTEKKMEKWGKRLTIDMAFSTSSLFRPAIRPLNDSRASLSFFKRTCPSKEATSLSFAWKSEKQVWVILSSIHIKRTYSFKKRSAERERADDLWLS